MTVTDGKLEGDAAIFNGEQAIIKVDGKQMVSESYDGEHYGQLPKVVRKSPTLNAEPPAEAIVLFDGL